MGRLLLVFRLVIRDLRNRPSDAVLLLLAVTTAAAALTLGLVVHDVTSGPFRRTRQETAGPDLVARAYAANGGRRPADRAALESLTGAPGVTAHSGPYPVTWVTLRGNGHAAAAMIEGRDQWSAPVDRPMLTTGSWLRPGAVVLERGFAAALGAVPGGEITLNGRVFTVSGIAVTAAMPSFPAACSIQAGVGGCTNGPDLPRTPRGLVWTSTADAESLATPSEPLGWLLNLTLGDPDDAPAYAAAFDSAHTGPAAPQLVPWQRISAGDAQQISEQQQVILVGSWLLGLLAMAGVALLAGGRMAGQMRRVGLLKALGASPGFIAFVLLAEHLAVAVAAAASGLALGRLVAPSFTKPSSGLIGSTPPPSLTVADAVIVVVISLLLAAVATFVPALRGALTGTARALAVAARPPRRSGVVTRASSRMPVVILLGMRIAARRPRRTLLSAASWAVTVAGVVATLMVHAQFSVFAARSGDLANPLYTGISQVITVLTAALVLLTAVNALLITWMTVLDNTRATALTRALGASATQVAAGLAVAQMLPAVVAGTAGLPAGIALYEAVRGAGAMTYPVWPLAGVLVATPLAVGALTLVPSRLAARAGIARVLQSGAAR